MPHPQTIIVTLKDLRKITMAPLPVNIAEAIAGDYTAEEVRGIYQNKFSRDLIAACITHINGKPVDHETFTPRKQFQSMTDWSRLSRAYDLLNHTDSLRNLVQLDEIPEIIVLPSSRTVSMSPLTLDQFEHIEQQHKGRINFLTIRHNMAASAVTYLDGIKITENTDLRLELPNFSDWNHICAAFDKISIIKEDDEDFLECVPASEPCGGKLPTQLDTAANP